MALIRRSAASLAALADTGSVAELMFEQTLYGYGPRPSPGEARSWSRSIPVLAHDLVQAGLGQVEVLLEHRLPLSSRRVDAILAGRHPRTELLPTSWSSSSNGVTRIYTKTTRRS